MKTFDLTVSRTIHGSADEVYDVWLDPTSPGGLWFGVERAIVNPVVDSRARDGVSGASMRVIVSEEKDGPRRPR
jgi:hypothetical protein